MGQVSPEVQFVITRVCQAPGLLTAEELISELTTVYYWSILEAKSALFQAEVEAVRTDLNGRLVPVSKAKKSEQDHKRVLP